MGEIKLHEAPTITVMAKGMKLNPSSPAMAMAMGNMNTAEATLVTRVSMAMHPANTTARAV